MPSIGSTHEPPPKPQTSKEQVIHPSEFPIKFEDDGRTSNLRHHYLAILDFDLLIALLENPPCSYIVFVTPSKASLRWHIKTLFNTISRTYLSVTIFNTLSTSRDIYTHFLTRF
jgi:hypothetical protein